ncbi:MAG: SMC-Scp complex subunit ScpB [Patescibacteria group bacterium]|jgi:segregation and condensation protein B|nr:SMC-Scp complex subunit ScpB [Patescibacteria group bacterium]
MSSLKSKIESLLFVSAKPMSSKQLADVFKKDETDVKKAGDALVDIYKNDQRGIQIIKNGSKYQMVSSPENSSFVSEFIKDETTGELSRPSLETLTIVAYRGPIAKLDLDRIRGVNCSLILRNLLLRGLVLADEDKERGETIFNVSFDFLRFLGVNDVKELPDYEKLHKDETIDNILNIDPSIDLAHTETKEDKEDSREGDVEEKIEEDGYNKDTGDNQEEQIKE